MQLSDLRAEQGVIGVLQPAAGGTSCTRPNLLGDPATEPGCPLSHMNQDRVLGRRATYAVLDVYAAVDAGGAKGESRRGGEARPTRL